MATTPSRGSPRFLPAVVAHVGMSRPPSDADVARTCLAYELGLPEDLVPEPVDLFDDGRDFLVETYRYRAVVLHSIFYTGRPRPNVEPLLRAQTSPRHSLENWRARLVATGAAQIFVFEILPVSLSGWNLGELPGYRITRRDHEVTVYEREEG